MTRIGTTLPVLVVLIVKENTMGNIKVKNIKHFQGQYENSIEDTSFIGILVLFFQQGQTGNLCHSSPEYGHKEVCSW